MDAHFIFPTSNFSEGPLSITVLALSDSRKAVNPADFEEQMYLNTNCYIWVLEDVKITINS